MLIVLKRHRCKIYFLCFFFFEFENRYIAADRFSNLCWILQNAAMKQPAADVNEIHEAYENVLMEGRLLKIHLAKLLNKAPDTSEIDSYQAS